MRLFDEMMEEQSEYEKAIEELKEEVDRLREENKTLTDEYMIQKHLINANFLKDYIPISVIQNKIDELESYRFASSLHAKKGYTDKIKLLQELLEERNKQYDNKF